MKRGCLLGIVVGLVGCAQQGAKDTVAMTVFEARPPCAYQSLGEVQATSGRVRNITLNQDSAGGLDLFGERASPATAMAQLKADALALGANALILRSREIFEPADSGRGSLQKRQGTGIKLRGLAIVTEAPPRSKQCQLRGS